MEIKLNVGFSKKIGQPDYGSIGASCGVELDLDASQLNGDPKAFHERVRRAFVQCAQAVEEELARQGSTGAPHTQAPSASSTGNGSSQNGHQASQKQVDYIGQLARQIKGLGVRRLEQLCQTLFGKPQADLSSFEASSMIDSLKALKEGRLSLQDALQEGGS